MQSHLVLLEVRLSVHVRAHLVRKLWLLRTAFIFTLRKGLCDAIEQLHVVHSIHRMQHSHSKLASMDNLPEKLWVMVKKTRICYCYCVYVCVYTCTHTHTHTHTHTRARAL